MSEWSTFIKLRQDEREIRRNMILTAAIKLFEGNSFYDIGMRDIAFEAGVSAAAIYRYFQSRDDLFIEALIQDVHRIARNLETLTEKYATVEDLAISVVDYLIDNEASFQMMCHFMILGENNSDAFKKFNAVQIYFLKMFNEALKRSKGGDKNRLQIQAFFASLAGVVLTFRHYPGRSQSERREYIHKFALKIMHKVQ